jgi:hypothetical protein
MSTSSCQKSHKNHVHAGQRGVNGCTSYFDGNEGIEAADGRLKGDEVLILVWENAEMAWLDSQTNTCGDVLFGWLEPSIVLSLWMKRISTGDTTDIGK